MSRVVKENRDFKIELREKRILRLMGHQRKTENSSLAKLITKEKKRLDDLLNPVSLYTIIDYEETNKHAVFNDAVKVALCLCTIGPGLEKEVEDLTKKNDLLKALILDSIGSEAVEEVAIQSDKSIAEEAIKMNLWPSKRFSPGYREWDLKEQKFIFKMLPAKKIGIELNESFMMIPRKSISFRINFYQDRKLTTRKMN
jgi:cobalamin-dependent methionine synthase I